MGVWASQDLTEIDTWMDDNILTSALLWTKHLMPPKAKHLYQRQLISEWNVSKWSMWLWWSIQAFCQSLWTVVISVSLIILTLPIAYVYSWVLLHCKIWGGCLVLLLYASTIPQLLCIARCRMLGCLQANLGFKSSMLFGVAHSLLSH